MPSSVDDLRDRTFHVPPPWPAVGKRLVLPAEEARHALRALRLRSGERVRLVDGEGREGVGRLRDAGRGRVAVELDSLGGGESLVRHLALAAPWMKSPARLDWLIEKGTELGLHSFHLYRAERSVKRTLRDPELRRKRWRALARAAMKQAGRAWWPRLGLYGSLGEILRENAGAQIYLADAAGPRAFSTRAEAPRSDMLLLVVGPEGGLTEREVAQLSARDARPVGLGPLRLRVETAALALSVIITEQLAIERGDVA